MNHTEQAMKTAEDLTDAEYAFYERSIRLGKRIKPCMVATCKHCGDVYHVSMGAGASFNRCGAEACKLSERAEQVKEENTRRTLNYRIKQQNKAWKHDTAKKEAREAKILAEVAGFSYV